MLLDLWQFDPLNGVGLVVTKVHASPPEVICAPPVGMLSSIHIFDPGSTMAANVYCPGIVPLKYSAMRVPLVWLIEPCDGVRNVTTSPDTNGLEPNSRQSPLRRGAGTIPRPPL